jgi:hypothetical protein
LFSTTTTTTIMLPHHAIYSVKRPQFHTTKHLLRLQDLYVEAAKTKPEFDKAMKALAANATEAGVTVELILASALKKITRISEKAELRPGAKGKGVRACVHGK